MRGFGITSLRSSWWWLGKTSLRPRHLLRPHQLIKLLPRKMPELQCGLAQADVFHMRGMGDLRGRVVSHLRRERGYEHERVLHVPVQFGAIDLNAFDHVLHVSVAGVGDQGDGMQEVVNNHRLVNVKLEIALRACESYRSGCTVNLDAYHGHGF